MTEELGTSMTSQQYRYYKCYHVRKKKCNKKNVRKEWIEDLILDNVMKFILDDNIIDELAEHIFNLQSIENHSIVVIKTQIVEVEKKLNNLIEAMTQGIFSSATKKVLDELEAQKKHLELELFKEEVKNPILTKNQILFALYNYRKLDLTTIEEKNNSLTASLILFIFTTITAL